MFGIRPYRDGDAEKVVSFCKDEATFYKWTAGILGEYPLTVDRFINKMKESMDNGLCFPFVAFDGDDVVGFFILRQPGDQPDLLRVGFVIVDSEIRGKGYGKKMLQLGVKYATEIYGVKKLSLGVFEGNEPAFYCYKAVGFEEDGTLEDYEICGDNWVCINMMYEA